MKFKERLAGRDCQPVPRPDTPPRMTSDARQMSERRGDYTREAEVGLRLDFLWNVLSDAWMHRARERLRGERETRKGGQSSGRG